MRRARQPSSNRSIGCSPAAAAILRTSLTWGADGPAVEDSPIFIVGFPRSGTTLLEQVLDSHPLLQSMDEQGLVLRAVTEITRQGIDYPGELGKLSASALN